MILAIVNNEKVRATHGVSAVCPCCQSEVIPICGTVVINHWRHKVKSDCYAGSKESDWHQQWKSVFVSEGYSEEFFEGNRRADILLPNGLCVEFQNSSITYEEVYQRHENWKKMIWVFNLQPDQIKFNHETYTLPRLRTALLACREYPFIDTGTNHLHQIRTIERSRNTKDRFNNSEYGGECWTYKKEEFVSWCSGLDITLKTKKQI